MGGLQLHQWPRQRLITHDTKRPSPTLAHARRRVKASRQWLKSASLVPGWNENKRYRLEKSYGDVETASFYGFNFYDVENGLGGPEWKASTDTEWTQRVRSNHAKPNIRRMWKIQHP
jgi:hypothetical protein